MFGMGTGVAPPAMPPGIEFSVAAGLHRRPPLKTESEILERSLAMGVSPN